MPLLGCTLHHSKQALTADAAAGAPPRADARFVTEEDSGLSILGMFVVAEPDHYAVLLERMRRDHRCARLLYPQLDFYTDYWLLVAFPISRITSICEPETTGGPESPIPSLGAAPGWHDAPAPAVSPPAVSPSAVSPSAVSPSAVSPAAVPSPDDAPAQNVPPSAVPASPPANVPPKSP